MSPRKAERFNPTGANDLFCFESKNKTTLGARTHICFYKFLKITLFHYDQEISKRFVTPFINKTK